MTLPKFLRLYAIGITTAKSVYLHYGKSDMTTKLAVSAVYNLDLLPESFRILKVASFYFFDDALHINVHDSGRQDDREGHQEVG